MITKKPRLLIPRRKFITGAAALIGYAALPVPARALLQSNQLIGFGVSVASAAATVTFTDSSVDATDATTYTFSTQSIGTASADRKVVVAADTAGGAASADGISSMTIAGESATQVIATIAPLGDETQVELWQADVPTGTTADIVVTWNGAHGRCGISVWGVTGALSAATDTLEDNSSTTAETGTIDVPAGGVLIAAVVHTATGTKTHAWTGPTEAYDEEVETNVGHGGASAAYAAAQTGLTVTATFSAAVDQGAMVAASWGPA